MKPEILAEFLETTAMSVMADIQLDRRLEAALDRASGGCLKDRAAQGHKISQSA